MNKYIKASYKIGLFLFSLILIFTLHTRPVQAQEDGKNPVWEALAWAGDKLLGGPLQLITGFIKDTLKTILQNVIVPVFDKALQFNEFFTPGVNAGWTATRDLANLFFALILLFIAIATVLNVGPLDNYTAKRMLPNFILVALLINFSKAIVGLFLDISQIIMIEFYNALGQNMATTIADSSRIAELGAQAHTEAAIINVFTALIIVVLIFVLLWTIITLIVRIVTLWIVIITAPLAFIGILLPPLKSLYSQWTEKFQSALVTGPVLMIMLYLAMMVLQGGIGSGVNAGGTNFIENTSFFDFLIVIIMLIMANTYAQQAGQQAPGALKGAVGWAGSFATFGLGAIVGVGGVGPGRTFGKGYDLVKGGMKNTDQTIGGVTRGLQLITGGKLKLNDRYENWKDSNKDKVVSGRAGGLLQQTLGGSEGRKQMYEASQVKFAEEARLKGTLEKNPILKRALAKYEASIMNDYKEEEDENKIIQDIAKAKKDGDTATARALTTHLNSIGKLRALFNEKSPFAEYARLYANEADQFNAFINDELLDTKSQYDTSFRARNANISKSKKGQENFSVGLKERAGSGPRVLTQPQQSPLFQKYKGEALPDIVSQLPSNIFSVRKVDPTTNQFMFNAKGEADYAFDFASFNNFIDNKQESELEDPKTWKSMSSNLKNTIITGLQASGLSKNSWGKAAAAWRGLEP